MLGFRGNANEIPLGTRRYPAVVASPAAAPEQPVSDARPSRTRLSLHALEEEYGAAKQSTFSQSEAGPDTSVPPQRPSAVFSPIQTPDTSLPLPQSDTSLPPQRPAANMPQYGHYQQQAQVSSAPTASAPVISHQSHFQQGAPLLQHPSSQAQNQFSHQSAFNPSVAGQQQQHPMFNAAAPQFQGRGAMPATAAPGWRPQIHQFNPMGMQQPAVFPGQPFPSQFQQAQAFQRTQQW